MTEPRCIEELDRRPRIVAIEDHFTREDADRFVNWFRGMRAQHISAGHTEAQEAVSMGRTCVGSTDVAKRREGGLERQGAQRPKMAGEGR